MPRDTSTHTLSTYTTRQNRSSLQRLYMHSFTSTCALLPCFIPHTVSSLAVTHRPTHTCSITRLNNMHNPIHALGHLCHHTSNSITSTSHVALEHCLTQKVGSHRQQLQQRCVPHPYLAELQGPFPPYPVIHAAATHVLKHDAQVGLARAGTNELHHVFVADLLRHTTA